MVDGEHGMLEIGADAPIGVGVLVIYRLSS
jgi:hypothetical protein